MKDFWGEKHTCELMELAEWQLCDLSAHEVNIIV